MPIVAIVGRANVGKSSLFNTIIKRREAIVAREPGTTRDAITAKAEHKGKQFWMVDTAGMKTPEDDFELTIQEQVSEAVASADIIWVVVEASAAISEEDRRVAKLALRSGKPTFLVLNKIDQARGELAPFERLGIKSIFKTSATQNRGIENLLTALVSIIPKATLQEDNNRLHMALLGRPNVGKSSLFNALAKKQQAIVADRAGTTRDLNRTVIKYEKREIELIDTAGIRRPGKTQIGIEHFSVLRSLSAIAQADICLLLMDVNELNTALDQKIAGMIKDAGKGLVIVVAKWDIAEGKSAFTRDNLAPQIAANFEFTPWAPLIFTSSITGQNVTRIFELALEIAINRNQKIPTSELNNWLQQAIANHPPAGLKNREPKLNYIVQEIDNPTPAFKLFGSQTKYLHWSYRRYLEKNLREKYNYTGTPVELWFIEKHLAHKHGQSPTKTDRL